MDDQKPRERFSRASDEIFVFDSVIHYGPLPLDKLTESVRRLASKLLDEQHAAGQVPVAAVGQEPVHTASDLRRVLFAVTLARLSESGIVVGSTWKTRIPSSGYVPAQIEAITPDDFAHAFVKMEGVQGVWSVNSFADEWEPAPPAPVAASPAPTQEQLIEQAFARQDAATGTGWRNLVAAPPAQPARDESCQECGVVGGGHRFECMARYKPPAQSTAVEPGERWHESQAYREQQMDKVVANIEKQVDPVRAAVAADYERAQRIKAQQPAQPTAVEPVKPCPCFACRYDQTAPGSVSREMVVCPKCGNKRCPKAAYHGSACTNSNAVGQLADPETEAAEPAVPVAGERLNELVNRIKSALPMTMRNESECDARLALRAIEGAYARMERERDSALSQVETLQAGKLEAERVAAELKAELRERDQREASLRDDVSNAMSDLDTAKCSTDEALQKLYATEAAAKDQVEALRGELGAAAIDNETLEKERDMARASLTAEKERAERLEARIKELRAYAFTFRKSKRDERICCNCEEPRHGHYSDPGAEPGVVYCSKYDVPQSAPLVATGERSRGLVLTADTYVPANPETGDRARIVATVSATPKPGSRKTMSTCSACNGSGWKAGKWTADREVCPECQGSNEPAEKIWQVLSRDADGDDEWEVNDPGPYTRADADRRVEMWSISSSIYRFKTARIPTPAPLTESGNEMLGGGDAGRCPGCQTLAPAGTPHRKGCYLS